MSELLPVGYDAFLLDLKARVRAAQLRAGLAVNRELVLLYWRIGQGILEGQARGGWGAKLIDRLASDLKHEFPEAKGFSSRNLKYMRAFAEAWPDESFVQQVVAQIPWGHNVRILDALDTPAEREWYARATIEHGWSRNILVHQIDTRLHLRQGQAHTNFERALPPLQSDLAQGLLKDPYLFDFLSLAEDAKERDLERGLLGKLRQFLLELGSGFAFMGSQYHLAVADQDFYIDLLFYHHRLRCLVAIELKAGNFKPEYAGKMNFYLSALDAEVKHPDDGPSVGLGLCRAKSGLVADYALRGLSQPIGVSTYQTADQLPPELRDALPTLEQLQQILEPGEGEVADDA